MKLTKGNVEKEVINEKEISDYISAGWKVKETTKAKAKSETSSEEIWK